MQPVNLSDTNRITRRRFLQGSIALGASGLLLGCSDDIELTQLSSNTPPDGEMHEWVFIGTDNTIIITNPQTEMGQGVNTSLPQIMAEELDADWHSLIVRQAPLNSKFGAMLGMQMTGGSLAVATYYDKLRIAGATAWHMILQAAAQTLNTDINALTTKDSHVLFNGKQYPYGQFALQAAQLPIPEADKLTLKQPNEFNLIGKPVKQRDSLARVTGTAQFGIDVQLPNMLNGTVIHAPIFGSRPLSWDGRAALKVPGFKQIIVLEHALLVIAEKYWQAQQAARVLKVTFSDYDHNKPGRSSQEIMSAYTATLDNQGKAEINAEHVLDVEYTVPFLAHATMEPMNATAWVQEDRADVWAPSQSQTTAGNVVKELTGFDDEQIHLHHTLMGGGFGRRGEADFVALAVTAAMAMQAPVKITWSREEDIQHDMYRPAVISRFQIGLDNQYQPTHWHNQLASTSVIKRFAPAVAGEFLGKALSSVIGFTGDMVVTEGATNIPYLPEGKSPDTKHVIVDTNIPVGAWRSVGHSSNAFFTESVIDEAAQMAGIDPYLYRSQLLVNSPREKAVLDKVAELGNWGTAGRDRYQGIAVEFGFNTYTAMLLEISLTGKNLKVHKVFCAVDCGRVINPNGATAQIEGGINFALSAAMQGEITIADSRVEQSNFHDYPIMRLAQSPKIEVHFIASNEAPTGLGEVGVPPLAPALCNAIYAATGQRLRSLPLKQYGYQLV